VGSMRRKMSLPSVLFPHPLSPTSPIVSPRRTLIDTPSTARSSCVVRPKNPCFTGKYFASFSVPRSVRARSLGAASEGSLAVGCVMSTLVRPVASRQPPLSHVEELRLRARAFVDHERAPVCEAAAARQVAEIGHHSFDHREARPLRADLAPSDVARQALE